MHHGKLTNSSRLQAVLTALQVGGELSTREIILRAGVCAVNSCVAELRANGADITCRQECRDGKRLFFYRLAKRHRVVLASTGVLIASVAALFGGRI